MHNVILVWIYPQASDMLVIHSKAVATGPAGPVLARLFSQGKKQNSIL